MKTKLVAFILALCMAAMMAVPALAEETVTDAAQSLIERAAVSCAVNGIRDEEALSALAALNPSLGEKWTRIMDLWEAPVMVNETLPDGLPEDDSLCLVGLGFQLNPDGTMRDELIERLKVILAASEKYPNAVIVCTGGGTAADDPTATEAGRMAEWLEAQGVNSSRLIVEDHSLTTAQNAIYTFDILSEKYPQVKGIAIISSDYHIATGTLLFGAEAILRDSEIEVVSNASWHAPSGTLSAMFQAGALIELSGDVETAFDIYYETYDIHELPPLASAIPGRAEEQKPLRKVIFDTDMLYLSDDAVAMFMLAAADSRGQLELLGVTTVGANCFAAQASCAALRQLELIGRSDIPVYQGTDVPLGGFRDMETEARLYGVPYYCGAYWSFETNWFVNPYARPTDYLDLGDEPMFGYPETRLQEQTAWDFMIEQVHKYPGEVTIMAVGAATNVAIAIQKDPTLVNDAAGIIYMGGDIDVPGNASAAAEMNWFYDPDAIRLCLAADWKSQLVVPDDLAQQIYMDTAIYARLHQMEVNRITELVFVNEDNFDPSYTHYVWDVVVPAVFLRPGIMIDLQTRYLTVDDQRGLNYGRAVSWAQQYNNDLETGRGMPEGVKPVQILMKIDEDAFWDFYAEMLTGKLD